MRTLGLLGMVTILSACGSATRDPVELYEVMQAAAKVQALVTHVDEMTASDVRTAARAAIDLSAQYAKWQLDLTVNAWDSIPVEQRRVLLHTVIASVKSITTAVEAPGKPAATACLSDS